MIYAHTNDSTNHPHFYTENNSVSKVTECLDILGTVYRKKWNWNTEWNMELQNIVDIKYCQTLRLMCLRWNQQAISLPLYISQVAPNMTSHYQNGARK